MIFWNVKIPKPYYSSDKELEKFKFRDFNGTEYEKIFVFFSSPDNYLTKIFPKINMMTKFHLVFNSFWILFSHIKKYRIGEDLNQLDSKLRAWIYSYISFSRTLNSTLSPYLHIFSYHMKELLELHGNINLYNTQGLERLNSTQSSIYFRTSNKNPFDKSIESTEQSTYIKQIVDIKNRNDFHTLNGSLTDLKS